MSVLVDLKNRGVKDVFFLVCDGLKGLPQVVEQAWPQTIVQTCLIHLIRNSFRLTSRKHWDAIKRDLKAMYEAPTPDAAEIALEELDDKWSAKYPAMVRLWRNAWNEFIPFLDYDIEIRRMICSTNAIESLNARYREPVTRVQGLNGGCPNRYAGPGRNSNPRGKIVAAPLPVLAYRVPAHRSAVMGPSPSSARPVSGLHRTLQGRLRRRCAIGCADP